MGTIMTESVPSTRSWPSEIRIETGLSESVCDEASVYDPHNHFLLLFKFRVNTLKVIEKNDTGIQ